MLFTRCTIAFLLLTLLVACNAHQHEEHQHYTQPERTPKVTPNDTITVGSNKGNSGMVIIPSGTYSMGGTGKLARADEFPKHLVQVDSFWMDAHEVTNAQFREFVEATGYKTIAERIPTWEEIRDQLPPGTPKPPDSVFVAGSMVFQPTDGPVNLDSYFQWWAWQPNANWKQPDGPASSIERKADHPAVHICWYDAAAYCKWRGGRLPTEAEWEWAARGRLTDNTYPWGNEHINQNGYKANSWQGDFPYENIAADGYLTTAPVKSFEPNGFGLYDMAGNIWEWCSDWYHSKYYEMAAQQSPQTNPIGPNQSFDERDPYTPKRVQRGGSYLCNDVYCASYRVSARMPGAPDTGMPHVGCRCVRAVKE